MFGVFLIYFLYSHLHTVISFFSVFRVCLVCCVVGIDCGVGSCIYQLSGRRTASVSGAVAFCWCTFRIDYCIRQSADEIVSNLLPSYCRNF